MLNVRNLKRSAYPSLRFVLLFLLLTGWTDLAYGRTISGRVTDGNDTGITGVTLTLSNAQSGTAQTDASGNYSFTNLPEGNNYTVTPSKANYTFTPGTAHFIGLYVDGTANFTGRSSPDFNADGKPDLVWQNQASGQIGVWLMNGMTRLQAPLFSPDQVSDLNWKIVGTGDFNADGKPDLVWQHQATGEIGVWYMNGTTLVEVQFFTPTQVADTNWKIRGVGDFNADGKPDLVWQHQATGQIGVWLMNGTSLVSAPFFTPAQVSDTNWKIAGVDDFNADGKPDLVWQHQATGQLGVWYMNGTTRLQAPLFTPNQVSDTNWKIVGVRDFNSDNKPDLVWQNQINGYIGVWLMNGVTMTEAPFFNPSQVSDTNWRIVSVQ